MPLKGDTISMINGTHSYNERRGFVVRSYRITMPDNILTAGVYPHRRKCDIVIKGWKFIEQSPHDMSSGARMVLTEKTNRIFNCKTSPS